MAIPNYATYKNHVSRVTRYAARFFPSPLRSSIHPTPFFALFFLVEAYKAIYHGNSSPSQVGKRPEVFSRVAPSIYHHRPLVSIDRKAQSNRRTHHFDNSRNTLLNGRSSLLQAKRPSTRIPHIRLDESTTVNSFSPLRPLPQTLIHEQPTQTHPGSTTNATNPSFSK